MMNRYYGVGAILLAVAGVAGADTRSEALDAHTLIVTASNTAANELLIYSATGTLLKQIAHFLYHSLLHAFIYSCIDTLVQDVPGPCDAQQQRTVQRSSYSSLLRVGPAGSQAYFQGAYHTARIVAVNGSSALGI